MSEDDYYDDDEENSEDLTPEEAFEKRLDDLDSERAQCTCHAFIYNVNSGRFVQVADCCCGAA